jgi:O-antigen/teichoic acid export membrane protein
MLSSIIVVRALGPQDYGIYVIAFLIPNVVVSFGSFNLGPSIIYHHNNHNINIRNLFFSFLLLSFILGTTYYAIFYLFADILQNSYLKGKVSVDLLFISMLLVPVLLSQKYVKSLLRATNRVTEFTIITHFLPSFFRLVLAVLVLHILKLGLNGMIWVPIINHLSIVLILIYALKTDVITGIKEKNRFISFSDLKKILFFGLKGHLGGIIQKANDQIAMIIMIALLEPSIIGFFSLAVTLANFSANITYSITTVLVPKVARSSMIEIKKFVPKLSRILFSLLMCIALFVAIIVPFFVKVAYGEEFKTVVPLCWMILPGLVFLSVVRITNVMFTQTGMPMIKSITRGTGLFINTGMLFLLLPTIGVYAAAISLTFSYLCMMLMALLIVYLRLKIVPRDMLIFRVSDFSELLSTFQNLKKRVFMKFKKHPV